MKNIKNITRAILIIVILISFKISGCEQEDLDFYIDCDSCLTIPPDSADLTVFVTINDENPFVPLIFYVGNYEDNVIDWVDTTWNDTLYLYSEVGKKYSVKATYIQGGETTFVIDGDELKIIDGEGECYPPCYAVRGGTLDVKLKE